MEDKDLDKDINEESEKKLSREEEIEAAWAETLHLDYDPEEARRREEAAKNQTPPPSPQEQAQQPPYYRPPMGEPAPQPYGQNPQPGFTPAPGPYPHREPMPDTYLVWSVLATIFCCILPGIVALVYSTLVSSRYYAKDYDGARRASETAQWWIIISIVLGVISMAVYLPLSLFMR